MKKALGIILLFPLLMASCSSKNNDAIYVINNYSNNETYFSINAEQITNRITAQDYFMLYLGSDYCQSCIEVSKSMNEYLSRNHYMIYRYDNSDNQYSNLHNQFPEIFVERSFTTPIFYVINNGKAVYATNDSYNLKGNRLNKLLDAYSIQNYFNTFTSLEGFTNFVSEEKEALLAFYSSNNENQIDKMVRYIYINSVGGQNKKSINKKILLVDIEYLTSETITYIENYYGIDNIKGKAFVNSNMENVVDYTIEGGTNELLILVNNYITKK